MDLEILKSLSLLDLKSTCQTNHYLNQLCKEHFTTKKLNLKIDSIIHFSKKQRYKVNTYSGVNIKLYYFIFLHLLHIGVNIDKYFMITIKEYIEDFNDDEYIYYTFDFTLNIVGNDYYCYLDYELDDDEYTNFTLNHGQLKEFLTHLIYNNMIFIV